MFIKIGWPSYLLQVGQNRTTSECRDTPITLTEEWRLTGASCTWYQPFNIEKCNENLCQRVSITSNGQNYAIVCPNLTYLWHHSRTALLRCLFTITVNWMSCISVVVMLVCSVRVWDVIILCPNALFLLYLVIKMRTAVIKLSRTTSPVLTTFFLLVREHSSNLWTSSVQSFSNVSLVNSCLSIFSSECLGFQRPMSTLLLNKVACLTSRVAHLLLSPATKLLAPFCGWCQYP